MRHPFEIHLSIGEPSPRALAARRYDPALDSILSILYDLCEHMEAFGAVTFHVAGFGQDAWPVDVTTDLVVILEQLPEVIARLRNGEAAELCFFEQGIERDLHMTVVGGDTEIVCLSALDGQPDPRSVRLRTDDLVGMLESTLSEFIAWMVRCCPELEAHELVVQWLAANVGTAARTT